MRADRTIFAALLSVVASSSKLHKERQLAAAWKDTHRTAIRNPEKKRLAKPVPRNFLRGGFA
jgi:hypothetical protein